MEERIQKLEAQVGALTEALSDVRASLTVIRARLRGPKPALDSTYLAKELGIMLEALRNIP